MNTMYGTWRAGTSVHAVGYDGKYLCGKKESKLSTECGGDLSWVDCKRCRKLLPDYLMKHALMESEFNRLKNALNCAKAMAAKAKKKENTGCAVEGMPEQVAMYLESWVIPEIQGVITFLEKNEK